ncbi:putative dead box ATP-dependent RNA helicase [Monocercomonoides exilis]|uniref:putative dead box ATP-dependent RNA helicase n=1 Tax=Monocercomonoides exilis TaxID=2049356 RepID=UPI003559E223|nr:putative dead box ATP-dependent RNA helicase [Monocercomonoides exilis]|eukprot:MONOS_2020.1-p1 / transcript=MONOS_2020.1 / gene=MONOS_2020 / organism=Monocercomonoides_exilis_PA203 / gene_product=dead box ATP-dependent RNA helicase, putative / transcript_product=dead box ATP-dependent RNA helicase, putative / location=Mono_scaffold00039:61831-64473(-) / protein_length=880 / sequence_SO=supercontig / SO=protein_coding / is_pseudo=false
MSEINTDNKTEVKPSEEKYVPPHRRRQEQAAQNQSGGSFRTSGISTSHSFQSRTLHPSRSDSAPLPSSDSYSSRVGYGGDSEFVLTEEQKEREKKMFANSTKSGIHFDDYDKIDVEVSGKNFVEPFNNFVELDFGQAINRNIRLAQYQKPTPIQKHAIPIILENRDLMACAQTGSGKTAAFLLPILAKLVKAKNFGGKSYVGGQLIVHPLALILAPTRELSIQIFEEALKFSHCTNVIVSLAYGGRNMKEQVSAIRRHGSDLIVATPGRLTDLLQKRIISLRRIEIFCLDEADTMLDMGFAPQIREIVYKHEMPETGRRQTLMFSATFPVEIQRMSADFLSDYLFVVVGKVGTTTQDITQKFEKIVDMGRGIDDVAYTQLVLLLQDILGTTSSLHSSSTPRSSTSSISKPSSGGDKELNLVLVFTETKAEANKLEHQLNYEGFQATSIHGDRTQEERENALFTFRKGLANILVATDVAARGLDIPFVRTVINYTMPRDIERYVHRIGRTGRVGNPGTSITFIRPQDGDMIPQLIRKLNEANQEIPEFFYEMGARRGGGGGGKWGSGFGGRDFRRGRGGGGGGGYGGYGSSSSGGYGERGSRDDSGFASVSYTHSGRSGGLMRSGAGGPSDRGSGSGGYGSHGSAGGEWERRSGGPEREVLTNRLVPYKPSPTSVIVDEEGDDIKMSRDSSSTSPSHLSSSYTSSSYSSQSPTPVPSPAVYTSASTPSFPMSGSPSFGRGRDMRREGGGGWSRGGDRGSSGGGWRDRQSGGYGGGGSGGGGGGGGWKGRRDGGYGDRREEYPKYQSSSQPSGESREMRKREDEQKASGWSGPSWVQDTPEESAEGKSSSAGAESDPAHPAPSWSDVDDGDTNMDFNWADIL